MWIFAALVTSLCFGINNSIFKWSNGKGLSKIHIQFFFYLVAFICTFGYSVFIGNQNFHILTILIGALIGILNTNGNIQLSRAFEKGPASLTAPLVAANAIFPILCSALIFHEHISSIQWIGIFCMMVAVVVIQYTPNAKGQHSYFIWIMHVCFAIFSFGTLGVLMQTSAHLQFQSLDVLTAMYGGGSIYLLIILILKREKIQAPEIQIGTVVGLLSIMGYGCYFYALSTGISSIIFPIVSLNCLFVVFAGCYLFQEKLRIYQISGILIAIIGIILTKI
ncbi:EamA family transporter [Peribacillus asahii]|uniref:EamA family transporter n=1 Tax=Peribacillus asahii TaxID=228899 RepID=A0A398BFD3_9BACI|nr:DMT family transporter [Peribacillus asahii]RID88732.1 EamA family transporter [Peribacillus asahii]